MARDLTRAGRRASPWTGENRFGGKQVTPLRTLVAVDEGPAGSALIAAMEDAGCEVVTTSSSGAWMLLDRIRPDLLFLDPACGGGAVENWRRSIGRYRRSRALGLLVVSPSASIRALFSSAADLGVHDRLPSPARLKEILAGWGEETEPMREAS